MTSELGVGSTFTALIPAKFAGKIEEVYVPSVKRELDATRLPVLVVEDNREALFIYEKYLKGTGFQVIPASNVREAREAIIAVRPHAIILDVLLEGEHSWDLLRELKQDPATRDIPVYVITVVDNREKAIALGADGFQSKPIDRLWLLNQLRSTDDALSPGGVLIIDDDATSRYLTSTVLSNIGCEVVQASHGEAGLRLAREIHPSLIVLDLVMEGMDGFAVLEALQQPETRDIPVVVQTSKALDEDDLAKLHGALDVIPKSIMGSRELVSARLSQALKKIGSPVAQPAGEERVTAE